MVLGLSIRYVLYNPVRLVNKGLQLHLQNQCTVIVSMSYGKSFYVVLFISQHDRQIEKITVLESFGTSVKG